MGIIRSLWRWRELRYGLLIIWLVVMSMPAILTSDEMPQSQRMSGIILGVYGLAALGVVTASDYSRRRLKGRWHLGISLALALLVLADGGLALYTYFGVWSQRTDLGFMPQQWHPDDNVHQQFEVPLPAGIPAGPYTVRLVYSREGGDPLPVVREGRLAGDDLLLGKTHLDVEGRLIKSLTSEGIPFGETVHALSYEHVDTEVPLGGDVLCAVTWQAREDLIEDHTVELFLEDAAGHVARRLQLPIAGAYSASQWLEGEVVTARYRVPLGNLETGDYSLYMRMSTSERHLELGTVQVVGRPRRYEVPAMKHSVEARFGEVAELLGYDLEGTPAQPAQTIPLSLYWRALDAPTENYKVFVHLVDQEEEIVAQHDSAPANWTRPTTGWQAGEVVTDEHELFILDDTPPGTY